jgi:isopentenyldiphosphate isomerase
MACTEEIFEIVNERDEVVGTAGRSACHGNPALIHRTAHVVVTHPDGRILLQKRSPGKDVQPGRWDTAVGGHLLPGEDYLNAARREMAEELGLPAHLALRHLFDLQIRNRLESENVRVYGTVWPGPFRLQPQEIDEVKFWSPADLRRAVAEERPDFTPNLKQELRLLLNNNSDFPVRNA